MNKEKLLEELERINKICKDTVEKIDEYLERTNNIIEFPVVGILCPVCYEKLTLEHSNRIYLTFKCECGERCLISQATYRKINYINVRL